MWSGPLHQKAPDLSGYVDEASLDMFTEMPLNTSQDPVDLQTFIGAAGCPDRPVPARSPSLGGGGASGGSGQSGAAPFDRSAVEQRLLERAGAFRAELADAFLSELRPEIARLFPVVWSWAGEADDVGPICLYLPSFGARFAYPRKCT